MKAVVTCGNCQSPDLLKLKRTRVKIRADTLLAVCIRQQVPWRMASTRHLLPGSCGLRHRRRMASIGRSQWYLQISRLQKRCASLRQREDVQCRDRALMTMATFQATLRPCPTMIAPFARCIIFDNSRLLVYFKRVQGQSAHCPRPLTLDKSLQLRDRGAPIDIFLSHDWPLGIEQHGDTQALLREKPFFKQEASSV